MINRRKYKRPTMIGLIDIKSEPGGSKVEAYAINISYGGMAIYSKQLLTGRLQIKLYYEDGTGQRLGETVTGKVAWKRETGEWYAIGLQFDELNKKDHSMTLDFVDRAME